MKLSKLLGATLVALSTLALTANGALAARVIQASKEGAALLVRTDPNGAKKCTDGKGTVATDAAGNKYCIGGTPPTGGSPSEASTLNSSKSNSDFRTDPAKACTDAGGTVATDAAGIKYCVKPKPTTLAPAN